MQDNRLTIQINKPVAEVFAFTITPPNSKEWISFITDEKTNEWPPKVGTIYSGKNDQGQWFDIIVAAIKENEMIEWVSEDGNYHVRYEYKSIDENMTELSYYEWTDIGELEDAIEPFTQQTLEKLKEVLESMNTDKKRVKIILIHGNGGGNAQDNWFPYIKSELEKLGLTVIGRDFPDPILARQKYWLPFLKNNLKADEHTIIIGHSSGAVAAMRYAEQNRILGSILVGACYTDLGDENERKSGYYDHPWDWEKIKHNQQWIVEFASTDDPYIPIEEPRFIHEQLDTEYYEYTDQGHFGSDKNKTTFPEIVDVIKRKTL